MLLTVFRIKCNYYLRRETTRLDDSTSHDQAWSIVQNQDRLFKSYKDSQARRLPSNIHWNVSRHLHPAINSGDVAFWFVSTYMLLHHLYVTAIINNNCRRLSTESDKLLIFGKLYKRNVKIKVNKTLKMNTYAWLTYVLYKPLS